VSSVLIKVITLSNKDIAYKKKVINHNRFSGSQFIPAGVLIGMGFGFLFHQFLAGLYIGLGFGFLLWAIYRRY